MAQNRNFVLQCLIHSMGKNSHSYIFEFLNILQNTKKQLDNVIEQLSPHHIGFWLMVKITFLPMTLRVKGSRESSAFICEG